MSFPSKNSSWMLLKHDNQICSLVLKKKTKTNKYNSNLLTHFSNHVTVTTCVSSKDRITRGPSWLGTDLVRGPGLLGAELVSGRVC